MFFKSPPFGLNFSDTSIEIISLGGSIEKPRLLAMNREPIESGIIEDGKIIDRERLGNVIKSLIDNPKFGKIGTRNLVFSFPESKIFLHFFKFSDNLETERIEKEIEFQAIHNFPFPLKDLYSDFKIMGNEVLLVAAQKDIVDDYLMVFKRLKLLPIALEAESISLARALIGGSEENILIVDLGARTTNFSLFSENRLKLSCSINIAGDKFSQALMEKLDVPFREAEELKKEVGLDPTKMGGKIFLILQKDIRVIISEIQKIGQYFEEKTGKSLEKIILAGGSATLPRFPEYLAENLQKPVLIGDPWKKINIDILKRKENFEKALEVNPVLYGPVIGSALRGIIKEPERAGINLLPKK
jgi:type IV pilus assembly protein PilM